MLGMTTGTITRRMPVHLHLRFGIGATPIRATTLRYPNARFRGDRLFSSQVGNLARIGAAGSTLCGLLNSRSDLTRQASAIGDVRQVRMPPGTACTLHHPHEGHVDEHVIEVSRQNPDSCTSDHRCGGHDAGHVHGPGCGHDAVPHGDHVDYRVSGHLHHPHGDHCDDHGPLASA